MKNEKITQGLRKLPYILCGVSFAALTSVPVNAQTGEDVNVAQEQGDGRNIIIVTARTFEENLQDVPIAVSTLSAEQLDRQNLNTLNDIAQKTPGFSFEDFSGSVQQPSIRGQINLRSTSPVQNVATYLDGIYLQRGYLIDQSITELEQVEVIKGPQSALYGRNAFAGVINLQTRRPDLNEFRGKIQAGIGTDELYEGSAWASLPIIPGKLAVLGSVAHSQFDGTWANHPAYDNIRGATRGNVGGYNKEAYQVRAIFKPIDRITIDAMYIHTDRFQEAPASYSIGTRSGVALSPSNINTLNCSPTRLTPMGALENRLFCGELPVEPIRVGPNDPRPAGIIVDARAVGRDGPTDVVSGRISTELSDIITASYQFGYVEGRQDVRGNSQRNPLESVTVFGTNIGIFNDSSGTDSSFRAYSHDARVSFKTDRLRAFFGANYNDVSDIESNATLTGPPLSTVYPRLDQELFPIGPGLPFPTATFQRRTYLETQEEIWGVYGFVDFAFSDAFSATVEGRYTFEKRIAIDRLTREPTNQTIQALVPPVQRTQDRFFAPRVSLNYQLTTDNLIYASAAKGVKSGGLNGAVPNVAQRVYQPETNWTYELGSKNYFPSLGLTLNAALFYTDWIDIQSNEGRLDALGNPTSDLFIVSTVTGNVGDAEIYGADVSGIWEVIDNVTLDFGASYARARYKDGTQSIRFGRSRNCDGIVCPTGPLGIGGNQIERTPEFDGFVGLGYNGDLGNDGSFYIRGDVTYQSKQFVDEANLATVSDRLLANAQAGASFGPFELNLWVKNLFDKEYVSSAFFLIGTGGLGSASYVPFLGQKRTAGLKVSYNF